LSELLVVAGEPSGDRAAARVLAALGNENVRAFGFFGAACEREGATPCARVTRPAMGALDVAARGADVMRAMLAVRSAVDERAPRAALLVNYTDFNAALLGFLRRRGVRVLWYAAPQIWAWRAARGDAIAKRIDAMAVILPFEEALWRARGARTRYVGHPAMEISKLDRHAARKVLDLDDDAHAIAILPGSRPSEVQRLLPAMLDAIDPSLRKNTRVLLTNALDDETKAFSTSRAASAMIDAREVDAARGAIEVLSAFDVALTASGTASLECVMCDVPPIVCYKLDALAAFVARRALRTTHVALPNVLLARRAFPELLQENAEANAMRRALDSFDRARALADCGEVRRLLGEGHVPSRAVAEMISPWLR
jgi:lipid-A-disaccharide synthase